MCAINCKLLTLGTHTKLFYQRLARMPHTDCTRVSTHIRHTSNCSISDLHVCGIHAGRTRVRYTHQAHIKPTQQQLAHMPHAYIHRQRHKIMLNQQLPQFLKLWSLQALECMIQIQRRANPGLRLTYRRNWIISACAHGVNSKALRLYSRMRL